MARVVLFSMAYKKTKGLQIPQQACKKKRQHLKSITCASVLVCVYMCACIRTYTTGKCVCMYVYIDLLGAHRGGCVPEILKLHIGCKFNAGMKVLFGFSK